ncbi:MAG TPA: class I SAM-dependent methyltransferase [Micropepsaceae bacterium]|jgi:predicted O-methyltransferase YrrM|nr:class I SAM-dependent methyltransferase [Micropepsaceae bacterium]
MSNTLAVPNVAALLASLFAKADATDPLVLANIQKEADARFGGQRYHPSLTSLFDSAFLPVPPEVGQLLYVLTRSKRPATIVEVGTSYGISAIHFAAALNDNCEGRLITAELSVAKAKAAKANLKSLGLDRWVEIRQGNAFDTLAGLDSPIDMLFLDGWKDFYLPLLKALEPQLAPGALVIGDDTKLFPERLESYLAYVRDPANYQSVDLPIGDGVELSVRL